MWRRNRPIQFLCPALNGMKAYGCLPCAFSGKNRSGSYNSGFGKYLGSRWMNKVKMETEDPAGMIDPSKIFTIISYIWYLSATNESFILFFFKIFEIHYDAPIKCFIWLRDSFNQVLFDFNFRFQLFGWYARMVVCLVLICDLELY